MNTPHDYPALCRSLAAWLIGESQGAHRELKRGDTADRLLEIAALLSPQAGLAERGDDTPHRAVRLDLSLEADTRAALITALENIGRLIAAGEMTSGCSAGYDSGYTYTHIERGRPTHDEYAAQLKDWLAIQQEGTHHG
jgi:hypothetical protein